MVMRWNMLDLPAHPPENEILFKEELTCLFVNGSWHIMNSETGTLTVVKPRPRWTKRRNETW